MDELEREQAMQSALIRSVLSATLPPMVTRDLPPEIIAGLSMSVRQPLIGATSTNNIPDRPTGEYYRVGRTEGSPWIPIPTTRVRYGVRTAHFIAVHEDGESILIAAPQVGRTVATTLRLTGLGLDVSLASTHNAGLQCHIITPYLPSLATAALATRILELERYSGVGRDEPVPGGVGMTASAAAELNERLRLLEHVMGVSRTDPIPLRNPGLGHEERLKAFEALHAISRREPVPTTLPTAADPAQVERLRAFENASGLGSSGRIPLRLTDPSALERRVAEFESAAGITPGQPVPPRLVIPGTTTPPPPPTGGGSVGPARLEPTGTLPADTGLYQFVNTNIQRGAEPGVRETLTLRGRFLDGRVPTSVLGANFRIVATATADTVTWQVGTLHVVLQRGEFDTLHALVRMPRHLLLVFNQQQTIFEFSDGGVS